MKPKIFYKLIGTIALLFVTFFASADVPSTPSELLEGFMTPAELVVVLLIFGVTILSAMFFVVSTVFYKIVSKMK